MAVNACWVSPLISSLSMTRVCHEGFALCAEELRRLYDARLAAGGDAGGTMLIKLAAELRLTESGDRRPGRQDLDRAGCGQVGAACAGGACPLGGPRCGV